MARQTTLIHKSPPKSICISFKVNFQYISAPSYTVYNTFSLIKSNYLSKFHIFITNVDHLRMQFLIVLKLIAYINLISIVL